ncbi:multiple organellar RNA editing factor 8, chloroplastic/mitochondrial-like [Gastrolobium bilobum]|uniref:multiple organellar RNA editing factor 8, chloroplastic/mitochondrial-like n=1 Tax=Gastrolobium bilobum TaxID=150636 RepID=UPI002AB1FED7|nr:multiple organellar RNA editing factor 8, chloroplastic/mitochondrial-like [Gastrolobium bilobum]
MATQIFSRTIPKSLTLASLFSRSFSFSAPTPSPLSALSFLRRLRPLAALRHHVFPLPSPSLRTFSTRGTSSAPNEPSPKRIPKENIMLDGCDFEHWLVIMNKPEGEPTREEIIDGYIKTLAKVVGSEEEARMKIYSVSTKHYYAFGALITEELSEKIKDFEEVQWVLPDSYLNVKEKDYGGEPFINGQAVPYDPKFHEEWVKNNANENNRRDNRPRNADRSRNFERRRENVGGSPPRRGYSSMPTNNSMDRMPQNNYAGMTHNKMGGFQPNAGWPSNAPSRDH